MLVLDWVLSPAPPVGRSAERSTAKAMIAMTQTLPPSSPSGWPAPTTQPVPSWGAPADQHGAPGSHGTTQDVWGAPPVPPGQDGPPQQAPRPRRRPGWGAMTIAMLGAAVLASGATATAVSVLDRDQVPAVSAAPSSSSDRDPLVGQQHRRRRLGGRRRHRLAQRGEHQGRRAVRRGPGLRRRARRRGPRADQQPRRHRRRGRRADPDRAVRRPGVHRHRGRGPRPGHRPGRAEDRRPAGGPGPGDPRRLRRRDGRAAGDGGRQPARAERLGHHRHRLGDRPAGHHLGQRVDRPVLRRAVRGRAGGHQRDPDRRGRQPRQLRRRPRRRLRRAHRHPVVDREHLHRQRPVRQHRPGLRDPGERGQADRGRADRRRHRRPRLAGRLAVRRQRDRRRRHPPGRRDPAGHRPERRPSRPVCSRAT